MKTVTVKTQIENMTVELTNNTQNGTRYMLCINNRRVYTSEDLTVNNEDLCWLVNKYYDGDLTTTDVLNTIIMMYNEAEAKVDNTYYVLRSLEAMDIVPCFEVAPSSADYVPGATKVPYTASEIPASFDAETEDEDNDDNNTVRVITKRGTVINFCKTVFALYSARVSNFNRKLVSFDYYSEFEVAPRFYNATGSPQLL